MSTSSESLSSIVVTRPAPHLLRTTRTLCGRRLRATTRSCPGNVITASTQYTVLKKLGWWSRSIVPPFGWSRMNCTSRVPCQCTPHDMHMHTSRRHESPHLDSPESQPPIARAWTNSPLSGHYRLQIPPLQATATSTTSRTPGPPLPRPRADGRHPAGRVHAHGPPFRPRCSSGSAPTPSLLNASPSPFPARSTPSRSTCP